MRTNTSEEKRREEKNWRCCPNSGEVEEIARDTIRTYFIIRGWENPERDIKWHLDNCDLPSDLNGQRNEVAWRYLVEDVIQRPLVERDIKYLEVSVA